MGFVVSFQVNALHYNRFSNETQQYHIKYCNTKIQAMFLIDPITYTVLLCVQTINLRNSFHVGLYIFCSRNITYSL
jgi:hypothetical protein